MITENQVRRLVAAQFPEYAGLTIIPVEQNGIDNDSFRLGQELLIRLPSAACYATQVKKEHTWLPFLDRYLSVQIPRPIHMGLPDHGYPFNWSIYRWISGDSANLVLRTAMDWDHLPDQLARFIKELHQAPTTDAPLAGWHNFHRGAHLSVYDQSVKDYIGQLNNVIDKQSVLPIWEKALLSSWKHKSVWVHGDIAPGNMIIQNNELAAIIDFGCMGVGDPACDLAIAWTFFEGKARKRLIEAIALDSDTWNRAKAWVLWKALFELTQIKERTSQLASVQIKRIQSLCLDE